jgi:hypothetical protein
MQKPANKTDCSFVRRNLFSYQEKQLPEKENKDFEDHLDSCRECARIVSEFQAVTLFINIKKTDEPNPFAGTRIIQRIESEMQRGKEQSSPILYRILQPVFVSVLMLIAVIIGFSIVKRGEPGIVESKNHENEITTIQSDLNIPDFIDEDNTFFANQ